MSKTNYAWYGLASSGTGNAGGGDGTGTGTGLTPDQADKLNKLKILNVTYDPDNNKLKIKSTSGESEVPLQKASKHSVIKEKHGLTVGDVFTNVGEDNLLKISSTSDKPVFGIVTKVVSENEIEYAVSGELIPMLPNTEADDLLYLSNTDGVVTNVKPTEYPIYEIGYNTNNETLLNFDIKNNGAASDIQIDVVDL